MTQSLDESKYLRDNVVFVLKPILLNMAYPKQIKLKNTFILFI